MTVFRDIDTGGATIHATRSGDVRLTTGDDLTSQWAMRAALANPGSLTHRPDFGAGLERFVQAPVPVVMQQASAAIRSAIRRRAGIRAVKVSATPSPATASTTVSLEVEITTETGERRQITVGI